MEKVKCSKCGQYNEKIFSHFVNAKRSWINGKGVKLIYSGKNKIFKDKDGGQWSGMFCPKCNKNRAEKYSRSYGVKPRGLNHKNNSVRIGFQSELIAKTFFENLGFSVEQAKNFGPDLVCRIGDLVWTVEVKTARYYNYNWSVDGVCKNRINDDLVAVVFPDGVYVNSMKDHSKKCRKASKKTLGFGSRSVTDYRKELSKRLSLQKLETSATI